MTPRLRKLLLVLHISPSVGSLGAVTAYLAIGVAGMLSEDALSARTAFLAMELIGWLVVAPLIFLAFLTGLAQSLLSEWGLFRTWWIAVKFVTTLVVIAVLVRTLAHAAEAIDMILAVSELADLRKHLVVHAAGGLVVLLGLTAVSIYRPWGLTPYGRARQDRRGISSG